MRVSGINLNELLGFDHRLVCTRLNDRVLILIFLSLVREELLRS